MLDITVFSLCAAMSLMFCWFTVEAPTFKEKMIVAAWVVIIPSLIAAYDVPAGGGEVTAAVKGALGPWVGVTVWQLYQNQQATRNYQKILSRGVEGNSSDKTSGTERRQDARTS